MESYRFRAFKKTFGSVIMMTCLVSVVIALLAVLGRKDMADNLGLAIGLFGFFGLLALLGIVFSIDAAATVTIDKAGIELRGIRGVMARCELDNVEKITLTSNPAIGRVIVITEKQPSPKKKSLFFDGKQIVMEQSDAALEALEYFFPDESKWDRNPVIVEGVLTPDKPESEEVRTAPNDGAVEATEGAQAQTVCANAESSENRAADDEGQTAFKEKYRFFMGGTEMFLGLTYMMSVVGSALAIVYLVIMQGAVTGVSYWLPPILCFCSSISLLIFGLEFTIFIEIDKDEIRMRRLRGVIARCPLDKIEKIVLGRAHGGPKKFLKLAPKGERVKTSWLFPQEKAVCFAVTDERIKILKHFIPKDVVWEDLGDTDIKHYFTTHRSR